MIISKSCNSKNINCVRRGCLFTTSVKFIVTARMAANCLVVIFAVSFCVDPTGDCTPKI